MFSEGVVETGDTAVALLGAHHPTPNRSSYFPLMKDQRYQVMLKKLKKNVVN